MKKHLFIFVVIATLGVFLGLRTAAAEDEWLAPVPAASVINQVGVSPTTHAVATHITFISHPKPPGGGNYSTDSIERPDGSVIRVEDIAATPGLRQTNIPPLEDIVNQMVDDMFAEEAVTDPAMREKVPHGFCPGNIIFAPTGGTILFECDIAKDTLKNSLDHQFEVGDPRKLDSSFDELFPGKLPLSVAVEDIAVDARETIRPYSDKLYPATVVNNLEKVAFRWTWTLPSGEVVDLEEPYRHVLATSSIAEFKDTDPHTGLITASFDPVTILKAGKLHAFDHVSGRYITSIDFDPSSSLPTIGADQILDINKHFSPLIYFREDAENGRLRLSYSSFQLEKLGFELATEEGRNNFLKLLLGMNFNPRAVVKQKNGFLVLNTATLGDIDRSVRDPTTGASMGFMWRDLLVTKDASGAFRRLETWGAPGEVYLPHSVVTYATSWNTEATGWNHNPAAYIDPPTYPFRQNRTDSANEVFQPTGLALLGAGVLFADSGHDDVTNKDYFLTVSGADFKKNIDPYIYKISSGGDKLYLDLSRFDPAMEPMKIGYVAQPYRVISPAGFEPHQVVAANFDGGCPEAVFTHHGADILWDRSRDSDPTTSWFDNHDGDFVRYKIKSAVAGEDEMYSSCFTILYGKQVTVDGVPKCIFVDPAEADASQYIKTNCLTATTEAAEWQIPTVSVIKGYHGPGKDALLVNSLNLMKIPMESDYADKGNYTGYAGLYENVGPEVFETDALTSRVFPDKYIRISYLSTQIEVPVDDKGQYLLNVWKEVEGYLGGVEAISVDKYQNFAGISGGTPPAQVRFGCPQYTDIETDTEVLSAPEIYFSLMMNDAVPGSSWLGLNVMPWRCLPEPPPTTTTGGETCLDEASALSDPTMASIAKNCCKGMGECTDFKATGCCSVCYPTSVPTPTYCSVWSGFDIATCCAPPTTIDVTPTTPTLTYEPGPTPTPTCVTDTPDGLNSVCCNYTCSTLPDELTRTTCCTQYSTCSADAATRSAHLIFCTKMMDYASCCIGLTTTTTVPFHPPDEGPTVTPLTPMNEVGRPSDGGGLTFQNQPGEVSTRCSFAVPPDHPECCIRDCGTPMGAREAAIRACLELCTPDTTRGDYLHPPVMTIPGGRSTYPEMCNSLDSALSGCFIYKLGDPSMDKLFAENPRGDGGSTDPNRTEFGYCDKVYDSRAPYIASIDQLQLAQTNKPPENTKNAKISPSYEYSKEMRNLMIKLGVPETEAKAKVIEWQNGYIKHKKLYDMFFMPFIEFMMKQGRSSSVSNNADNSSWLIKEAFANPDGASGVDILYDASGATKESNFRFARALLGPGLDRHITVILKAPPTTPPPGGGTPPCDCDPTTPEIETDCPECTPPPSDCPSCACTCCDGTACSCSTPCTPTSCGEGTPCTMPETKQVNIRCTHTSGPGPDAYIKWLNKEAKKYIPLNGDIFCEEDAGIMEYWISSPNFSPDNVNRRAIIGFMGTPPIDYTQTEKRPTKAVLLERPTIFMPSTSAPSIGAHAMSAIVMPDLTMAATVEPALASGAVQLDASYITSATTTESGMDVLNNVLSWQVTTGAMAGKAMTDKVAVVSDIKWNMYPVLSGWTVSGPSDAEKYPFAKVKLDNVWKAFARHADLVKDGVPTAQFFEALKQDMKDGTFYWPEYMMFSNAVVVGDDVTHGGQFSTNLNLGRGSGCGCNTMALPPDAASFIIMLIVASIATTGFIVVRVRAKRK